MLYLFLMILILAFAMSWIIAGLDTGKSSVIFKGFFITILMYISLCIFFSFEGVKGWATSNAMPQTFALQSFVIKEPSRKQETPGAIYMWVIPESKTNECPPGLICVRSDENGTPRAYKLPYSKEMHKQMIAIGEKLDEGTMIIVERGDGKGRKNHSPDGDNLQFYELPEYLDELRKD
jgi:hypothetical protein